jgi:hypothetical protein
MKREVITSNSKAAAHVPFTKVLDGRKHPVRGRWRRGARYYARLAVEDAAGNKQARRIPLDAATDAQAVQELRKLMVEASENRLRHIGRTPRFSDYLDTKYLEQLKYSGKKPDTIVTELGHINRWRATLGGRHLDKIRAHQITHVISGPRQFCHRWWQNLKIREEPPHVPEAASRESITVLLRQLRCQCLNQALPISACPRLGTPPGCGADRFRPCSKNQFKAFFQLTSSGTRTRRKAFDMKSRAVRTWTLIPLSRQ